MTDADLTRRPDQPLARVSLGVGSSAGCRHKPWRVRWVAAHHSVTSEDWLAES
jgi:hypothetical protein